MSGNNTDEVLTKVAAATRLREGPEGVRAILRVVGVRREVTTRQVAAAVKLPLPIVAAVRGELTSLGFFERRAHGVSLTDRGRVLVERLFGDMPSSQAVEADDSDDEAARFADSLGEVLRLRPEADVTLDQAKATPRTLARRAAYFDRNDALAGRRILCMGDDDFVSVALAKWCAVQRGRGRSMSPERLFVGDVDRRILDVIAGTGEAVTTMEYDARDPFPDDLCGAFDIVITDPPYTTHGAELFLSRAIDAVGAKAGARCFLSFGHLDPLTMRLVQGALAEMGWVIREWLPGFNEYEGSGVLAGVSLMAQLVLAEGAAPNIEGRYDGPLYTADLRPIVRIYRCQGCNAEWEVGPGTRWPTVANLKRQTCPLCGADRFRRVGQRPASEP